MLVDLVLSIHELDAPHFFSSPRLSSPLDILVEKEWRAQSKSPPCYGRLLLMKGLTVLPITVGQSGSFWLSRHVEKECPLGRPVVGVLTAAIRGA